MKRWRRISGSPRRTGARLSKAAPARPGCAKSSPPHARTETRDRQHPWQGRRGVYPAAMPQHLPAHPDLVIESQETVWKGRFPLRVVHFRNRRFDGSFSGVRTWELWHRGRAGAVLPYDPVRDCVVLIDQFRLPAAAAGIDPVLVEVPAGLCDDDEEPRVTAQREAEEEAGLSILRLLPIGDFLL